MERIGREPNLLERGRRDGDARRIGPRVESRTDAEALLGGRVRDQADENMAMLFPDGSLAALYGVTTKRLNEQVKRNRNRFPGDFMFRRTPKEKAGVVAKCDHLQRLKFSPALPHAFTEHGAIMLASVLNSRVAIQVSVHIVRAFIRFQEALISHKDLRHRLAALEKKYDAQFKVVFDAIRELMEPPPGVARRRIGFRWTT